MNNRKFIAILTAFFILALAVYWMQSSRPNGNQEPSSSPSPEVTSSPSPSVVISEGNTTDQEALVILDTPQEGAQISSPLTISGSARGTWFFEATFPVVLTNWDGLIIAEGYATAEGDWMTEEFVPFTAELTFDTPEYGERGSLILQKANPSGLPENDGALEITIFFAE